MKKLNKWNLTLLIIHIVSGLVVSFYVFMLITRVFTIQLTWYGVFEFTFSSILFVISTEDLIEISTKKENR